MESFITKKRRRVSPSPRATSPSPPQDHGEEDSTELKLAILASLHPDLPQDVLLDALLEAEGDIPRASASISDPRHGTTDSPPSLKRHKSIGHQTSLASTFVASTGTDNKPVRPMAKKGKTLHLFSPADVEAHTPCSIIHNFLPSHQADALLKELLDESPTFLRGEFQLFDRTVVSPHSFCFYVQDEKVAARYKDEYFYNGVKVGDVRPLLPRMREVSDVVAETVNDEVARRVREFYPGGNKLRFQSPKAWVPNAAFVNCYDGGGESVGYHSDQLTYLGPRAVIGSLSLGVAREFRVRRGGVPAGRDDNNEGGAIAIHLPHNSLLVMHAEMQEEWKHSIAPANAIDPHPLAGNKRLNITYRYYRDSFNPRFTPRCKCNVPATLKCVMKKGENRGRYMWMCDVGYKIGAKSCKHFEWAEFDDDGEPPWANKVRVGIEAPQTNQKRLT